MPSPDALSLQSNTHMPEVASHITGCKSQILVLVCHPCESLLVVLNQDCHLTADLQNSAN